MFSHKVSEDFSQSSVFSLEENTSVLHNSSIVQKYGENWKSLSHVKHNLAEVPSAPPVLLSASWQPPRPVPVLSFHPFWKHLCPKFPQIIDGLHGAIVKISCCEYFQNLLLTDT
ncbi:hypothetical protein AMECASPLE_028944 [Ameca splendens]|uniref:Uncharacterized protein n=1 Tax=Ameca splendens TaxID=208324 RepID=A0ABV0XIL2_9TELE